MCYSGYCYIANQGATFSITDTKRIALLATLLTQHNAKLLQKLKYDFKRKIKWNKYQKIPSA